MTDPAAADVTTLPVAEVFGPTFQGEGPSCGQTAAFVRVGGCNLTCRGCDTAYTWDGQRYNLRAELEQLTADAIMARLPHAPLVVITGGEPLLYQQRTAFRHLIDSVVGRSARVEIETNGTITPASYLTGRPQIRFNVSPKLGGPMSDDPHHKRIRPDTLAAFATTSRAVFKFVCRTGKDVAAAVQLADQARMPRHRVWVMPEGVTPAATITNAQTIADAALAEGVNLTLRQHVLLWPDTTRGR